MGTTTQAPERSLLQRMDALKRANDVRTRRAELKRALKARRVSIQKLLITPPEWLETAKVAEIMLAVPKYGRIKVNKMLATCRISPSKTFGGLSQRQRVELAGMLTTAPTVDDRTHQQRVADLAGQMRSTGSTASRQPVAA